MGNGMNKVLPGLYVGNYRDSKDHTQLERHHISHILAIHDSPRRLLPDKHYLCVMAADTPEQNLSQYFSVCNDFIHAARLRDGNVLIHCLAGMSRSVTVAVAYIMTVTDLNWKQSLKVVRAGRAVANPNLGFQAQLQEFEMVKLCDERRRLRERFPSVALEQSDRDKCKAALSSYEERLLNKDICEGNCSRGEKCPTGLCNTDTSKGIFRRRPSTSSRSRLSPPDGAQSCPTSPKHGSRRKSSNQQIPENEELKFNNSPSKLNRSPSTLSHTRPRSSPAGLYSYTGSAPSSVHGSRQDLSALPEKGSAIYLGCAPPRMGTNLGGSSWSISSRVSSSSGSIQHTPANTPPVSPSHVLRRTGSFVRKT